MDGDTSTLASVVVEGGHTFRERDLVATVRMAISSSMSSWVASGRPIMSPVSTCREREREREKRKRCEGVTGEAEDLH
jgi:hypothetical protein